MPIVAHRFLIWIVERAILQGFVRNACQSGEVAHAQAKTRQALNLSIARRDEGLTKTSFLENKSI
jgi:hypothetical protein